MKHYNLVLIGTIIKCNKWINKCSVFEILEVRVKEVFHKTFLNSLNEEIVVITTRALRYKLFFIKP